MYRSERGRKLKLRPSQSTAEIVKRKKCYRDVGCQTASVEFLVLSFDVAQIGVAVGDDDADEAAISGAGTAHGFVQALGKVTRCTLGTAHCKIRKDKSMRIQLNSNQLINLVNLQIAKSPFSALAENSEATALSRVFPCWLWYSAIIWRICAQLRVARTELKVLSSVPILASPENRFDKWTRSAQCVHSTCVDGGYGTCVVQALCVFLGLGAVDNRILISIALSQGNQQHLQRARSISFDVFLHRVAVY